MFNKYNTFLIGLLLYHVSVTSVVARLRTWSDYADSVDVMSQSKPNTYIGIRGFTSVLSVKSIQNNLKGKVISKTFYRAYCPGPGATDKWLCGPILTDDPKSTNGSASATVSIDLSSANFSTQNMDYQLPGFSMVVGKSSLTDGSHAELEFGVTSSGASSGGLFSKTEIVNINSLEGGVNLGGGPVKPEDHGAPKIPGLDKYKIPIDSGFNAELSKTYAGFNLIYDIDISEVKPFIGVGFAYTMYTTTLNLNGSDPTVNEALFGKAFFDGKAFNTQPNKFNRFTYSFMAGLSYPISDVTTIELGYKQTFGGNLDWNLVQKSEQSSSVLSVMTVKDAIFQEVFLGMKYNF